MNDKTKLVILGGGLAGLSAAYHSGGSIYEKEPAAGGLCRSERIDGYTFDRGSHIFHGRDPYVLNLLENALGITFKMQSRSCWIYSHGVYTKYPFQVNTYGLAENVVQDCLRGFREVCHKPRKKEFDNYRDWIYATFGKGIAEHFYIPHSEKFWTIPVEEMTTDWLDVRVPIPKLEDVVRGAESYQTREFGPNAQFRYPREEGMGRLPRGFLTKDLQIRPEKEAVSIDTHNKTIEFSDGEKTDYEILVSTIPVPELIRLLKDVPPEIKKSAEGLRCNSIFCVYIGIEKENLTDNHWVYFPEDEFPFFRISFPMNLSPYCAPKNRSSILAEVPYSKYRPIDRSKIIDSVIEALIRAEILQKTDKIDKVGSYDIVYGYPIYDHSRKDNVFRLERYLKEKSILIAGRYGRWEYQWMHDAILDGKRVAEEADKLSSEWAYGR
ncbi:MAG: FAD-dependent oxidoreductase [Candidatus Omnitrophota bacterium]|nr:MAG: FAD-dependent oxidoreductase [Candidatus Omnitrophota bacterium]